MAMRNPESDGPRSFMRSCSPFVLRRSPCTAESKDADRVLTSGGKGAAMSMFHVKHRRRG